MSKDMKEASRKAFEDWCVDSDLFLRRDLECEGDVGYKYAEIDSAWAAWEIQQKRVDELLEDNRKMRELLSFVVKNRTECFIPETEFAWTEHAEQILAQMGE